MYITHPLLHNIHDEPHLNDLDLNLSPKTYMYSLQPTPLPPSHDLPRIDLDPNQLKLCSPFYLLVTICLLKQSILESSHVFQNCKKCEILYNTMVSIIINYLSLQHIIL